MMISENLHLVQGECHRIDGMARLRDADDNRMMLIIASSVRDRRQHELASLFPQDFTPALRALRAAKRESAINFGNC